MQSRNLTIDMAKGCIALIIPAAHITFFYSQLSVQSGLLGSILKCFLQVAGAQLFMFLLGFSFFLGRRKSVKFIIRRSVALFSLGYLLNFLWFVLPAILGLIPLSFFKYYTIQTGVFGMIDLLMTGNIFHCAAFCYLACGFMLHFRVSFTLASLFTLAVFIISPMTWGSRLDNFLLDYLWKLLNGCPPAVFYPFFPWVLYSLSGYIMGKLLIEMPSGKFYRMLQTVGTACALVGVLAIQVEPASFNFTYYRLGPAGTLLHCGLIMLWIYMWHFIAIKLKKRKALSYILRWSSTNLTAIYFFQGIFVCWLFPFFGFMELDLLQTLNSVLLISALTVLVIIAARLYKRARVGKRQKLCTQMKGCQR